MGFKVVLKCKNINLSNGIRVVHFTINKQCHTKFAPQSISHFCSKENLLQEQRMIFSMKAKIIIKNETHKQNINESRKQCLFSRLNILYVLYLTIFRFVNNDKIISNFLLAYGVY